MAEDTPTTLGIDTLATAWLKFNELASTAADTEIRDALRLAADIADSLSNLRSAVNEAIIEADTGTLRTPVDIVRELRCALEETAKMRGGCVMTDATPDEHLAEVDGATFIRTATGAWWARDRDNITIVRGAESRAEAARLYCEDKNLCRNTPDVILARIKAQYRPYDTLPEFQEGVDEYEKKGAHRRNPHDGYKGQAWDRGANAAMLYGRAMAYLADHPREVEKAGPGWLSRLLRTGRV